MAVRVQKPSGSRRRMRASSSAVGPVVLVVGMVLALLCVWRFR
jgi:hypothetical protein